MSTSRMRLPSSAAQALRLIAVVVFPTPPFWLATAMTLPMNRLHPCGVRVLVAGTRQRQQPNALLNAGSMPIFACRGWTGAQQVGEWAQSHVPRETFERRPREGVRSHARAFSPPDERDVSRETGAQLGLVREPAERD